MGRDDWTLVVVVAAAAAILVLFAAWPLAAQSYPSTAACQTPKAMAELLKQRYDEVEIGRGIGAHGALLIQLYASPRGSWTVVQTRAGQLPCVVAGGARWQSVTPLVGEKS